MTTTKKIWIAVGLALVLVFGAPYIGMFAALALPFVFMFGLLMLPIAIVIRLLT